MKLSEKLSNVCNRLVDYWDDIIPDVTQEEVKYVEIIPTSVEVEVDKDSIAHCQADDGRQDFKWNIIESCTREQDLSEEAGNLRAIIYNSKVVNLKQVVVLGANDGSWNKVLIEECNTDGICSYLWWKQHQRPALVLHSASVKINTQDIGTVLPYECNMLLCNMQPTSVKLELANLGRLSLWLEFRPQVFAIRVIHFTDKGVLAKLKLLQRRLGEGHLIGVSKFSDGPLLGAYFVQGQGEQDLQYASRILAGRIPQGPTKSGTRAQWPIPDELPEGVEQLAPLDIGPTLALYGDLEPPHRNGGRQFMKELGYIFTSYHQNNEFYKSRILHTLIEPLLPLIKDHEKWQLTRNDPDTMEATTQEKIDHAPAENHEYHEPLWQTYKALADYLRQKDCRLYRLDDEELELGANRQSKMGWQDIDAECDDMGDYLDQPELWKPRVAEFRSNLLAGHPIKADYNSSGKREAKTENRTRMIWSLCATGRLYEAQVLSSVDKLLYEIPYTTLKDSMPQDYGEIFDKMLKGKHAVCDDIKGWDTKISYSILCMEAAFLQLLSDDPELNNDIKQLYRLYAYPLVNKVESFYDDDGERQYRRVLYQLQGQVASGRRVTYSMNTITNIVINMTRAAVSQGVAVADIPVWVAERLSEDYFSSNFTGKVAGDDTVIVLSECDAKLFAREDKGAKMMNDLGLIRKKTGTGESIISTSLSEIEFCSRRFVTIGEGLSSARRIVPIRPVDEIIMRKLFREELVDNEYDAAWAREIGRDMLVEFYFIPTIRKLAFALLSATPNDITLGDDGGEEQSYFYRDEARPTESEVIEQINQHYYGKNTQFASRFRAQNFNDLGYINEKDRETYDLDFRSPIYKKWEMDLAKLVKGLQEPTKNYDNWLRVNQETKPKKVYLQPMALLILLIVAIFLLF